MGDITTKVPLTNKLGVRQGSHILYFYSNLDGYIENAVSFISTGFELNQHVVFIDSYERYQRILDKLSYYYTEQELENIHYVNNHDFYEMYGDFHFNRVLENLHSIVQPYVDGKQVIRLWGHVDWMEQEDIMSKLYSYECNCDITLEGLGYTTVCAYAGQVVPANIQIEMMKTHEFLMTDEELVLSNLYKKSNLHNPTIYPSLSVQDNINSEVDLYKQKLDFIHVVSHEVRNPLQVIKAFSTLLLEDEEEEERRNKLKTIRDYVYVIDNEISHIINTEQMLSTDALWQKKLILPLKAIEEVSKIMLVKARTQNIQLHSKVAINENEMLLCNHIGFKLIISNLLSNAIKYSKEGDLVTFNVFTEKRQLMIEVIDQGVGMTQEQLTKLFIKYEKMNQDTSGQGIGLFMVKKLVDHFEGSIEVESTYGLGSTFKVSLPIH